MWKILLLNITIASKALSTDGCKPPHWHKSDTNNSTRSGLGVAGTLSKAIQSAYMEIFLKTLNLNELNIAEGLDINRESRILLTRTNIRSTSYKILKHLLTNKNTKRKTMRVCRQYFAKITMKKSDLMHIINNKDIVVEYLYLALIGHSKNVLEQLSWYKNIKDRKFKIPNRAKMIQQSYLKLKSKRGVIDEELRSLLETETKALELSHRKLYSTQSYYKQKNYERIIHKITRRFDRTYAAFDAIERGNKKQAQKHLQDLASDKSPHAAYILAKIFSEQVNQEETAFHWMKTSADQGFDKGILGLAEFYNQGIGVRQDKEKAKELYMTESLKENPRALFAIVRSLKSDGPLTRESHLQLESLLKQLTELDHNEAIKMRIRTLSNIDRSEEESIILKDLIHKDKNTSADDSYDSGRSGPSSIKSRIKIEVKGE